MGTILLFCLMYRNNIFTVYKQLTSFMKRMIYWMKAYTSVLQTLTDMNTNSNKMVFQVPHLFFCQSFAAECSPSKYKVHKIKRENGFLSYQQTRKSTIAQFIIILYLIKKPKTYTAENITAQ